MHQMMIEINTPKNHTNEQPQTSSNRRVKPKKLYSSNEWMSDQIALSIMRAAGLNNTNKNDRAALLADDPGFKETIQAAGKANQYLLGSAYGSFYWKVFTEDTDKAREFHQGFVTGANLHPKSPILALRNRLASYHRYGNKSGVNNHDELYEMCLAAYRKWEAGIQTTQLKRTDRWVR